MTDPFFAFDWYFTDVSERDAARHHALADRPLETRVLRVSVIVDLYPLSALWTELPQNHPVAELWLESQTDLLATIYPAYGGFFRQSFTILRAWFEIAVHGVFFAAHYGQTSGRYEQWRRGQRNAPAKMRELAKSFASRGDKLLQVDEQAILGKLDPVYSFLSLQAHAKGLDIYDLQEGRDNVPRYLPKSYDLWYTKMLEAFAALCFLYRLYYSREIAAYLSKAPAELNRARELTGSLSGLVPDFVDLMVDAFSVLGAALSSRVE